MKGKSIIINALIAYPILIGLTNCAPKNENVLIQRIEKLERENQLLVQLAELEIDPNQLEQYLEFLQEGIRTSIKQEPGVLSLYAMADKNKSNRITVVEIYENQAAYESHIKSPHFLKYKNGTIEMVDSLKLTRTKPIIFAAKRNKKTAGNKVYNFLPYLQQVNRHSGSLLRNFLAGNCLVNSLRSCHTN